MQCPITITITININKAPRRLNAPLLLSSRAPLHRSGQRLNPRQYLNRRALLLGSLSVGTIAI